MRSSLYQLRAFKLAVVLARLLPRSALERLAVQIGRRCLRHSPAVQAALRENLRLLTGLDGSAIDSLAERNVRHFSAMLADYFYCAARPVKHAAALLGEWRGLEHFEAARKLGRGILLVTAHLGNWELGGSLLASRGLPMSIVTLEEPSAELTRWRDRLRQKLGIKTIAVGPGHDFAFVEMMQVLRRNEVLAMLVDRPYAGTGLPVNFCGKVAEFSSAPALLWQHTDAAVVPAFVLQESGGQYISFADAPLPFERGTDPRAALARNTQLLATHFETIIRQHPEQWFNYVPIWDSSSSSSH
jgi:KDO2-lipid IV(A) lauroyltransferase